MPRIHLLLLIAENPATLLKSLLLDSTRWTPASSKWGYNSYK